MMTLVNSVSYTGRDYIFFLLNLAIMAAYMTLVVTMLFPARIMPILSYIFSKRSRLSVAIFFFTATLTRAELAWAAVNHTQSADCPNSLFPTRQVFCFVDISTAAIGLHVLQAVFVWLMLIFLASDLIGKLKIDDGEE